MLDDGDNGKGGDERDHVERALFTERPFCLVPDRIKSRDGGDLDERILIEWQYGRLALLPLGL
jgi:hypothetical protein